ncbi:glutaredoxin family protein [Halobacteriaceae archaeon GCM10025711]
MATPVPITVYTREECPLCDEAVETIERVAADEDVPVDVDLVDVDADAALREEYGDRVPYVLVDGTPRFKFRVDGRDLRRLLADAQ